MVRKKVTRKVTKRTAAPARSGVAPQGRRFDNAQKQHALVLVASGMEVLRLVVLDGVMELRFCGARVQLGPLMT
jgi:hypothetical protein